MDDVDAVQAQIARNMLVSGDWVTPQLDGIAYLEKPPLVYWTIAASYKIFGVHDWAARIPIALSGMALCLLTAAFGIWAFGKEAGFYAGLCMATCAGLFLFTRVLIPDVMLVAAIVLGMWAFLRALDDKERHPFYWACILAASLGVGLLLKSLIAVAIPVAAGSIYLLVTHQFFSMRTWKQLHPISGFVIVMLIAAPWHVLATLRNPPHFAFVFHSGSGQYHGFLWFFVINEQVLRFLGLRYPQDYNTVPRLYFWLLNLAWLFPWSVYFPAVFKLSFKPVNRAGRTRLLALCWIGFVMLFFTFSTTQEYYSMPCYPAMALLLASAMAMGGNWIRWGNRALRVITGAAAVVGIALLLVVRHYLAPGDISAALALNPKAYTLSLGHMEDLTVRSLAYLRFPLGLACVAFLIGAVGTWRGGRRAFIAAALMMILFFHAARVALVAFDPYLSSRPLAEALLRSPAGNLIVERPYYTYSSIFFYADRTGLMLNGRYNNLEYASYAPGAPDVFLDDAEFKNLWLKPQRCYIVLKQSALPRVAQLVGNAQLDPVAAQGGKVLMTNHPIVATGAL